MTHAEYHRNHTRVKRTFGKASEYQCWLCFDPAVAWAHLWRTHSDASDPWSYVPLCRQDHYDYDHDQHSEQVRQQWRDPEFRAKFTSGMSMSERGRLGAERLRELRQTDPEFRARESAANKAKAKRQWQDPEFRAMRSSSARGYWRDPEFRARQEAAMPMSLRGGS